MQGWSLERKIQVSQTRILEWYLRYDNLCFISFSGGKDSTVLAYLAAQICQIQNCRLVLWFSDTGLEFPELKSHVKTYGRWLQERFPDLDVETVIDHPRDRKDSRISFREVLLTYGYPILSKNISRKIGDVQKLGQNCYAARCFDGRETGTYDLRKWKFVIDAPFKVSSRCCDILKKNPSHKFAKRTGRVPVIGTMADESQYRRMNWLKKGCNAFEKNEPSSQPLSFWTEQDILEMLVRFHIPYASVYGEIKKDDSGTWHTTGYSRTGCMYCAYGAHLEKEPNRFQRLKQTHPKIWDFCMKPVEEGGLGMREVLKYIHVKIE
jgi:3'-phosphoadenosine 5'-phosphosulfate sulfotransferase (PAPS reductase)/FAD synthetase